MGNFESFIGVNLWTALFVLINTLTVFFVAKKYLIGPVLQIIRDRQNEIDTIYTDADRAKQEAEALRADYTGKLSEARQTAERLVKEAVTHARHREEEIIRQANAEAGAILDKANADIALEKKKALNDAKDQICVVALSIAEKVVERRLNEDDQLQLIDRFIESLGDAL